MKSLLGRAAHTLAGTKTSAFHFPTMRFLGVGICGWSLIAIRREAQVSVSIISSTEKVAMIKITSTCKRLA